MKNFKQMTISQRRKLLASTGLPMAALVLMIGFQNCSPGVVQSTKLASTGGGGNETLNLEEDTKPVSVSYSENMVISLQSQLGIPVLSNRAAGLVANLKTKLTETGRSNTINGPDWLARTNFSAELCFDVITEEKAKAADQRRFFNQVNFLSGPDAMTSAIREDVIRRLARNLWSRNETPAERTVIKSSVDEAIAGGRRTGATDAAETEDVLLYTCTAMAASLDTARF